MGDFQQDVVLTLVLLECEFPLSFFDVMTYLLTHVVKELELCGPIHTWWM